MKKLLLSLVLMPLVSLAGSSEDYDEQQVEWASSRTSRWDPTDVWVDNEQVAVKSVTLPHVYQCGAILRKTKGGYRLDLPGIRITDLCIQANGDLAILVTGENYIHVNNNRGDFTVDRWAMYYSGIHANNLLVFGPGRLTIDTSLTANYSPSGISASDVKIGVGTTVTLQGVETGIDCNSLELMLAKIRLSGVADCGIAARSVFMDAACVAGTSSGTGISASEDITICRSLVDLQCTDNCFESSGETAFFGSYITLLSWNRNAVWSHAGIDVENCSFSAYAGAGYCGMGTDQTLWIGDGHYAIATGEAGAGLRGGYVVLAGGDVEVCAPKGSGCFIYTGPYSAASNTVYYGSFKTSDKIDIKKLLTINLESAAIYGVGSALLSSNLPEFLDDVGGKLLMAGINTLATSFRHGNPKWGIQMPYDGFGTVYQDLLGFWNGNSADGYVEIYGGTVLVGNADVGIQVPLLGIFGGSFNGSYSLYEGIEPLTILTEGGKTTFEFLHCVEEQFPNRKKGDKITSGWKTKLPSYYGTKSLFLDEKLKLYFWLPKVALCKLIVKPNNTKYGSASGSGTYEAGKLVQLKATAKSGYVFTGWFTDKDCTKKLNPAGYDNRKPTIKITMPAKDTTIYAKFNSVATDKSGLKFSDSTAKLAKTAKAYAANAKVSLALGFSSKSYPKVTATGLPSGLSIDALTGKITGTVKKPGAYTVKVTVTSAAGNKISQNVKIDIKAPSWAYGTFSGYGAVVVKGKTVPVSATFTATAVGKVSGKVIYKGRTASFTADYASATDTEARFTVGFSADGVSFKSAMSIKEKTSGLTYTRAHALKADSFELELQKVVPLVETGKSLAGMIGKSYTFKSGAEGSGLTKSGDKLVVKFAEKDVAKISGIVKGKSFSGLSASVMACGKSKKDGTTKYKLNVPVIAGTVGYYRLLTFKVTIDAKTKKVTKVEKTFSKIE